MSEDRERTEEVEEAPEALEEAPPDFVVDVAGLEVMVRVSDLLFEASRSSEPSKYIQEIEMLSGSVAAGGKKRRERKAAGEKGKRKASKKKAS